jgi:hypothetical protein
MPILPTDTSNTGEENYKHKFGYLVPFGASLTCVLAGITNNRLGITKTIPLFCIFLVIGWICILTCPSEQKKEMVMVKKMKE